MASIINASSSGSGGIVQTADASGVLQLQSNGTVALSISGAATTFSGDMLLDSSGNPSMTVKTSGAGNNPSYRLQAATNYWDMLGVFSDSNDTLRFRYNGTDRMVMNNSGVIALTGGDSDANGVGITFPATQVASTNANTLDDYEEGTFTPSLTFGGGSTGITYGSREGTYVKVGRMVYIRMGMILSNKGSSSGSAVVTGLPFTSQSQSYSDPSAMFNGTTFSSLSSGITGLVTNNGTSVNLNTITSTGVAALTNSNFNNTTEFYGGFCYVATA